MAVPYLPYVSSASRQYVYDVCYEIYVLCVPIVASALLPVSAKNTFLLGEPLPCNAVPTTALQPLI